MREPKTRPDSGWPKGGDSAVCCSWTAVLCIREELCVVFGLKIDMTFHLKL